MTKTTAALKRSLRDGHVTLTEAKAIAKVVKTAADKKALNQTMRAKLDRFDPAAQARLFVLAGPLTTKGDDPANEAGVAGQFKLRPGVLFRNGVSMHDVNQGSANDCTLLATLSGLAYRDPQAVRDMFRANPDGTVSVRFYQHGSHGPVPQWITVDRDTTGLAYAHSKDPKELWVALVEKAYAKKVGGYGNVASNNPDMLYLLTGRRAHDGDLDDVLTVVRLRKALEQGKLVTAANLAHDEAGLPSGHSYTVLGMRTVGGETYVRIRNPHGHGEPSFAHAAGADDGTFELTLTQFRHYFANVLTYDS